MDKLDNTKVSYNIFQDWKANSGSVSSKFVMVFYRIASWTRSKTILTILFFWYLIFYIVYIEWISGIQISLFAKIGKGFRIENGRGTSIDSEAEFGVNCTIRQLTIVGRKKLIDNTFSGAPKIGDNVDIGVNAIIIGNIQIGNNVVIGAGAVITKNVSDNSVMVGNPAKLLKKVYDFPAFEDSERKIDDEDTSVSLLDRV
ncbi:DapH/DapD/GlmU-related protein [Pedobacter jamesrossensis]|uniref:DapH/DapD/GlmU-related protein n=1 Tax=Pedobacter jamesrossensis TaxID=1908238 RepID=A0ABV8NPN1_9SPHI